jgi:exodeoxyribonuclease V alpha subunit
MSAFYPKDRRPKPPQPASPPPPGPQTIKGALKRITFSNAENGYTIARFVAEETAGGIHKNEEIVITGNLEGIQPGESLEATGVWTQNPRFGTQFAIEQYKPIPPTSIPGIQAFLASGLITGIGEEYAQRIVKEFGEQTLDIIDTRPERLREVEGIGPKRYDKITSGWAEHREIAAIMAFLQSYGISSTWASRIYRHYDDQAVNIMRHEPYRLALDIRGMGFKGADRIAQAAGVAPDSIERVMAASIHQLKEGSGKGHTFLPFDDLTAQVVEMIALDDPLRVREAVSRLTKMDASSRGPLAVAEKLPEGDKAVYLKELHKAETAVAETVDTLMNTGKALPPLDISAELQHMQKNDGLQLADQQRQAVQQALTGRGLILTGGPGTGKTTTVRTILELLEAQGVRVALAAPTGRAAKRLSETTRRDAFTIHRLLKFDPQKGGFAHNQTNPLPYDYLIVDEASMLDIKLAHQLLRALAPTASFLLVGDIDQLPSVGPGNVLRDLIDSERVPVVRLTEIFRQARQSLIVLNAHRINQGEFPVFAAPAEDGEKKRPPDFFFIEKEDPEDAVEAIIDIVGDRIPQRYKVDPIADIQVITPMHRSVLGAANLNSRLQQALNKDPRTLTRGNLSLRVGDKVMQTENNYDKDIYNGDIGIVHSIDRADHTVRVKFDRRVIPYESAELDALTLAYAVTVHKSQGSEYPVVVLPVHTQHFIMLQRNLLYTAVTRGKRLVVCVGTKKATALAVKRADIAERHSGLRQRLQKLTDN